MAGYSFRMHAQRRLFSVLVLCSALFTPFLGAQDNPMDDPDLQQLLKQAQEMQKKAGDLQKGSGSRDSRKNLADLEAMAKEQAAQQEQDEKREKAELQTALKKQLDEPGPVAFPDWTPTTPDFKPADKPTKKVVEEEVKIVQTGTSSVAPEKIAESWQAAATATNNLNQSLNKLSVNGKITRILFLSTRTDPRQEVELEASREPGSKITQVQISSPLPKPETGNE
ncbi:MAG TPA: hypothetical protein VIW07_16010 [Candidatus Udaeobacter sp.]